MKKIKMIWVSFLAIVMCASLIAGATFAIFTSEASSNIVVASGKVKVSATIGNIVTYSYDDPDNDGVYTQEKMADAGSFLTGGVATYDSANNEFKIENIVPGDKVEFDIVVKNESNVDIKYQVKVALADNKDNENFSQALYDALEFNEVVSDGDVKLVQDLDDPNLRLTKWKTLEYKAGSTESNITALTLSVELPYTVDDTVVNGQSNMGIQGASCTFLTVTVSAVQGNAQTTDPGAMTVHPGYSTGSDSTGEFEIDPTDGAAFTWAQIQSDLQQGLAGFTVLDGEGNDIGSNSDFFTDGTWDTNVSYSITNGTNTYPLDNLTDPNNSDNKLDPSAAPIGTTYSVTAKLSNVNTAKYQFETANTAQSRSVSAYGIRSLDASTESTSGEEVILEGIAVYKVKTVWYSSTNSFNSTPANPTYYTIEEALHNFDAGTIVVAGNTCFATPEIAKIAGYVTEDNSYYTVQSGVTLLVPYGESCSGFSSVKNDGLNMSIPSATSLADITTVTRTVANPSRNGGFATLTVTSGVNLTVNGTLTVNAVMNIDGSSTDVGGANMYINGANYGEMIVEDGSTVTLKGGSTFNSMGYTRGEGEIIVESGANVYEPLNATGFRGRNASMAAGEHAFPLNQFTLTSIVCKMIVSYGANYFAKAYIYLPAGTSNYAYGATAQLAGSDNKSFMQLKDTGAALTKSIDESTGKVTFAMNGNISVNNLDIAKEVTVPGYGSMRLMTSERQIPLAGHFKIDIQSGTTTIPNDVELKLLPGAELVVEKNATLDVEGSIYSYGESNVTLEGARYNKFYDGYLDYPIDATANSYRVAPTSWYTATTPAKVTVAGTLNVASGATMGCEVSGVDGGKLTIEGNANMNGSFTEDDSNNSLTGGYYTAVFTGRGVNADKTTSPLSNGDWEYKNGKWVGDYYEIVYHALGDDFTPGVLNGNASDLYELGTITQSTITTQAPTRAYHKFDGWYYDEDCTLKVGVADHAIPAAGEVIHVYAKWTAIKYTVEFILSYSGAADDSIVEMPTETVTWYYGQEIQLPQPTWDKDVYAELTFSGWRKADSGDIGDEITNISNVNIGDLDVIDKDATINLYGTFQLDNEVTVVFNVNAPQYTQDQLDNGPSYNTATGKTYANVYHWTTDANNLYASITQGNVTIENLEEEVKEIALVTSKLKGIDNNTLEYYFVGWRIKLDDGNAISYATDENGNVIIITDGKNINSSWVNDGNLELEGVWKQKSSLLLFVSTSSSSLTITVGNNSFIVKGSGSSPSSYNEYVYYYDEGTEISFTGSSVSFIDVYGYIDRSNIDTGKATGKFVMPAYQTTNAPNEPVNGKGKHNGYKECDTNKYADVTIRLQGSSGGSFAEGTLIMLADGTQKKVEDLKIGDMLLTFNHETGKYEAQALRMNIHETEAAALWTILTLKFSDGTTLRIADHHGLFDRTLRQYIFIDPINYTEFIGHEFSSVSVVNGEYIDKKVVLVSVSITEEVVKVYDPISDMHSNVVAEGLLTVMPIPVPSAMEFLVNIFEYDEDMKYNEEKMQADIDEYGLFTYEEFAEFLTYEEWLKAPYGYLKVAIGKGKMSFEDIYLIAEYLYTNGYL